MANITCDHFNDILEKFERNAKNYDNPEKVSKNIKDIHSWVEDQRKASESQSRNENIKNVGEVIKTSIYALEDLKSGNPVDVMKGSLSIISSVAVLVGGPYGIAASAICGVLGAVLSVNTPDKPNMATVFAEKVRLELQKFNQEVQLQKFGGLQARLEMMIKESASNVELSDKFLESDFRQFIGEVSYNINKSLSDTDGKGDINECITAMVLYCNAQMLLMLLMANIMATFQATGRETTQIKARLDDQKEDARKKLEFLSDKKYLFPAGLLPFGGGKMLKIFHLRSNLQSYETVDEFRQGLGMTRMPEFKFIKNKMDIAKQFRIQWVSNTHIPIYPQPHKMTEDHYFQLINHTKFPIKVFSGTAGDHINGLEFRQDIKPYTSYEHVASLDITRFFSAGGYFIMYLDGKQRSFETPFQGTGCKVFEFALSNPSIGTRKLALLEKNETSSVTGEDCWKQMATDDIPNNYFVHDKRHYAVGGYCTDSDVPWYARPRNLVLLPLRVGMVQLVSDTQVSRTWRFIVQEFNINNGYPVGLNKGAFANAVHVCPW